LDDALDRVGLFEKSKLSNSAALWGKAPKGKILQTSVSGSKIIGWWMSPPIHFDSASKKERFLPAAQAA
jgi:hypothetical protein